MSWTERTYLLLALLIALPFVASAQWDDEEEACSVVLEGKALSYKVSMLPYRGGHLLQK